MSKIIHLEEAAVYLGHNVQTSIGKYLVGLYAGHKLHGQMLLVSATPDGPIWNDVHPESVKLVLRPMSQLDEHITHNGVTFTPSEYIRTDFPEYAHVDFSNVDVENLPGQILRLLLRWHFDIHGLIEYGSAIPMNPDGTFTK